MDRGAAMRLVKKLKLPSFSKKPKGPSAPREPFDFFGLAHGHARMRNILVWLGFFALWSLVIFVKYPKEWGESLKMVFTSFLSQPADGPTFSAALVSFITFSIGKAFASEVLKYIPLFVLPNILGKYAAAKYLSDIFEFEQEDTAWFFISRAAFASQYQKITIDQGNISEEDRKSPVVLIGGPGYVQVNLDSAVLFEKASGEPEVIGPTIKTKVLEGFERLREMADGQYAIFDLRDQFVSGLSLESRSREGIRIKAGDIKVLFSIYRGAAPTTEQPYPFDFQAIRSLVYNQVVDVASIKSGRNAAFQWTGSMSGMVKSELMDLIASRTLSEILASIGELEATEDTQIQTQINELTRQVAPGVDVLPANPIAMPKFISRPNITGRFYNEKFKQRAKTRGLDLSWVDIGTWEIKETVMLQNHVEAWKLSQDNLSRKAALEQQLEEIHTRELIRLIQDVVTKRFANLIGGRSAQFTMRDLLVAYHNQLIAASNLYAAHKKPIPAKLARALQYLNKILDVVPHYVG